MLRRPAMKETWPFADWGPIPEPPASAWEWLRTVGEALLVAVAFTSGIFVLLLGVVVYMVILAALLCIYPFVSACDGTDEGPRS